MTVIVYTSVSVDTPLGKGLRTVRRWIAAAAPPDSVQRLLKALCRDAKPVVFIQVGSNDGVTDDPLRDFIRTGLFSGIMVEPVPYLFDRLTKLYRDHPGIILENVAIARQSGERDFYYLRPSTDPALPTWYDKLGSFSQEVILRNLDEIPSIPQLMISIRVPCVTVHELCSRHGLLSLDLIHIDAEGYDFEIIKSIDFSALRPAVLLYEHKHLGIEGRLECRSYLSRSGYDTLEVGDDTIAVSRAESPRRAELKRTFEGLRRRRILRTETPSFFVQNFREKLRGFFGGSTHSR